MQNIFLNVSQKKNCYESRYSKSSTNTTVLYHYVYILGLKIYACVGILTLSLRIVFYYDLQFSYKIPISQAELIF